MKRTLFSGILLILILYVSAWSNQINLTRSGDWITFKLDNQKDLGAIALPLKFADFGDDVFCDSFSFVDTKLSSLTLKEVIVDNNQKTVMVFAIVLDEEYIPSGEGALVRLKFSGEDSLEFESTTIHHQEGISIVDSDAEELEFDFDPVYVSVEEEKNPDLPTRFILFQNHPNPFNPYTDIQYALPENYHVNLSVYNILGQKVKTLVDTKKQAGFHSVLWDGKDHRGEDVATGIYFYKIKTEEFSQTKKMLLLR
ncbi:MAG: hypothetical protein AMJ90_00090 [candidate division Zixibacteria bacterium SM23_73_2]|nr:MAG: hypothetical protein AMJ90_00090 [candidate division Zixibacteria bacterium SM23_73_2]